MTPSNNIIELQNSIQPLVGVIDTGFNINMPGINYSQIQLGQDLIDSDSNPLLTEVVGHEHGSYTLQTIASSNNNAPLWIGRAVGSGRWAESLVEFVDVAKESTQPNAIVNLGFDLTQVNPDGSVTTRYELTEPERAAIEYARQNGILIVVAAGNENGAMSALGQASQEFDNIITVGSTENLKRADYSSYGSGLILLADGDMGNMAGTSFATSKVTGAISQVWAANPQLNYHQVFDILKTTATDLDVSGWDSETGYGLLNLTDAINLATMTTSIPYQTPPVETVSQILITENTALERPAAWYDIFNPLEWFSKVGEAAKWIADKLGDGLEAVFDTIGLDFVGEGINWLTDRVGEKVQAVIEREKSFIEGAGGKLEDLFSENLWEDFGGWLATNTGNALDRLGTDLETIADSFKINTRTLTNRELEVAKSVFGDSINYDLIRIDEWSFSGLINDWENHDRPYTTFHTINSWAPMDDATLIHELTHVWQYEQFGSVYISKAIAGQLENPLPGIYPEHIANNNDPKGYGGYQNGYGYGGYTELQDRMDLGQGLGSYNFEQQAEIIKHYFQMREDNYTVNDFHLPLYSHFVKEVSSLPLTTLYPLHVIGSTGDDKIYGNNTNNGIDGGLGNDTLKSWNGNDTLIGGWGNDSLYGDGGNDFLYGGGDNDYHDGGDGDDLIAGWNGNDTLIGGWGNDSLYGDGGNDSLYGGGDDDYHDGGDGDDLIAGWNGNDTLDGGGGSDSLYGDGGNDYLHGQAGDDTLDGGGGNDYLYSHSGNDILDGQAGDDIILGGDGNDYLYGGEDNDIIYGTAFPDPDGVSVSYLNNDNLFGQEGDDKLYGSDGDDYIDGGSNYDQLYGREGNDILIGGSGDDILTGSNPDVWNSGADEFDNLTGDAGADIFVLGDSSEAYYRGLASAEILDFNWNEGDKIRVFGSASNYSLSHTQMGDDVNPTPVDTAIIYQDDVIGVVHDTMDVFISRDFIFV